MSPAFSFCDQLELFSRICALIPSIEIEAIYLNTGLPVNPTYRGGYTNLSVSQNAVKRFCFKLNLMSILLFELH